MYNERLKQFRKSIGLSVPKLAERINIPARTIVSYESGRDPSIEMLAQLCKVYNVNLNWFVTGEGEMFIKQPDKPHQIDEAQIEKIFDNLLKKKGII